MSALFSSIQKNLYVWQVFGCFQDTFGRLFGEVLGVLCGDAFGIFLRLCWNVFELHWGGLLEVNKLITNLVLLHPM